MNRINESEIEMGRCHNNLLEQDEIIKKLTHENNTCHNNLLEQDEIIKKLTHDNNNLINQLKEAHEEIKNLKFKDENDKKPRQEIESEHLKKDKDDKN